MNDQTTEPNTIRTLGTEPGGEPASESSASTTANDTAPSPMKEPPINVPSESSTITPPLMDPDMHEREKLKAMAQEQEISKEDHSPAKYVRSNSPFSRFLGHTPGEREFNLKNWFGIGLGANSVLSIATANYVKSSHPQSWFERAYTRVGNLWPTGRNGRTFTDHDVLASNDFMKTVKKHAENHAPELLEKFDIKKEGNQFFKALEESHGGAGHLATALGHEKEALYKAAKETAIALQKSRGWARYVTNFALLSTGGWLLMAPIKWLEDHKAEKVKEYDAKYQKTHFVTDDEKREIERRHAELDQEPKQSWGSVLSSRMVAYLPIISAYVLTAGRWNIFSRGLGLKSFKGMDHYAEALAKKTGDTLRGSSVTKDLVEKAESLLEKGPIRLSEEYQNSDDVYKRNFVKRSGKDRLDMLLEDTYIESLYTTAMSVLTFMASWLMVGVLGQKQKTSHQAAVVSPKATAHTALSAPFRGMESPEIPTSSLDQSDQPGTAVSAAEYSGLAKGTERDAPSMKNNRPHGMPDYRTMAAASAEIGSEPARA